MVALVVVLKVVAGQEPLVAAGGPADMWKDGGLEGRNLQAKGRSLVCVRVCFLRSLLVVKSLGQAASRQLKVLPGGDRS